MKFDLIKSGWLPCLSPNGKVVELGMEEVLCSAGEIIEICTPSPLVALALHRLLLAFLHAAYRGPKNIQEWARIWKEGRFDNGVIARYLKRWRERFDLFDLSYPFYQVPGMASSPKKPVSRLAHRFASGNNPTLFDHGRDDAPIILNMGETARLLVTAQSFSLSGGKGGKSPVFGTHPYFTDSPLVKGMAVMLTGSNLFETLMFNLNIYDQDRGLPFLSRNDRPSWGREKHPGPVTRECSGWLDLLTWQSRYVLLLPEEAGVRWMHFAQGEVMDEVNRPGDPMWFYETKTDGEPSAVKAPQRRPVWSRCCCLFGSGNDKDEENWQKPLSFRLITELSRAGVLESGIVPACNLIGISHDMARVNSWVLEKFPLPVDLLRREDTRKLALTGLDRAESVLAALQAAIHELERVFAGGKTRVSPKPGNRIEAVYFSRLEKSFRSFLKTLPQRGEEALGSWKVEVEKTARELFKEVLGRCPEKGADSIKAEIRASGVLEEGLYRTEESGAARFERGKISAG